MKQSPHKKRSKPVFAPQDLDAILTSRIVDHSQQTAGKGNPAASSGKTTADGFSPASRDTRLKDRWVGIAIAAVAIMFIAGATRFVFRLIRGR